MGLIADLIRSAFRDYTTDGVAASGVANVDKAMVRSLGPALESAIANASLGALVTVAYSTRAALDADLAHADRTVALVYGDATDANNDLYVKSGASGAGSWTLTNAFHQLLLVAGAQAAINSVPFTSWAALSTKAARDGDRASVTTGDTGTHTDPVSSATVANAGIYQYSASPAGWHRIGDSDGLVASNLFSRFSFDTSPLDDLGATSDGVGVIAGFYDDQPAKNMWFGVDASGRFLVGGLYMPVGKTMALGLETLTALKESNWAFYLRDPAGNPLCGYNKDDGSWWAPAINAASDVLIGGKSYLDNVAATHKSKLTRWRAGLSNIADGVTSLVTLGLLGDSWTYFSSLYTPRLTARLKAAYGDGGDGFIPFATSSGLASAPGAAFRSLPATPLFAITTPIGSWANNTTYTAPTANLTELVSGTLGNRLQIAASGASVNTVIKLLYRPIAGSSIRYSWDGGATWQTTIDLSSGYVAPLSAVPTSGTWTLLIEDNGASARCALTGFNARKASGVLIHKVGSPGSTSAQWAAQAGTAGFQAHWAELNPDCLSILHGTNDQTNGARGIDVAANFTTIAAGVRTAVPWVNEPPVDLLYAVPAENLRTGQVKMSAYATAIRAQAMADGAAFLSLQNAMGPTTATGWWTDSIHPSEAKGGPALARAFLETLDR